MAKHINRLTATQVTHAKEGVWPDGAGLYLRVTPDGGKSWFFRFTRGHGKQAKEKRMGLGSLHDVGLSAARQLAADARRLHEAGSDPKDVRNAKRRAGTGEVVTFKQAFADYFAVKKPQLSNAKHKAQWQSTMDAYVFPAIGNKPVADLRPGAVIDLLKPIWHDKPETARRVLQRVSAVFQSAIVRHVRERANPCIGVARELGDNRSGGEHHRAMPYKQVPEFIAQLRDANLWPSTRLCFEWLILTATRSGEARLATWKEVDEEKALWTIPASRLKTRRKRKEPHRVPLSPRCTEILAALKAIGRSAPDDWLFPSMHGGKPLSDMTLTKVLRDMGLGEVATVHGMRSAFKTWAAETGVRDEVSEAALAHVDPNEVRSAYQRSDYLDQRRKVMRDWASFCSVLC